MELSNKDYEEWESVSVDKETVNLIYNNYEKELKIYQNKIAYWHTLKEEDLPEEAFDTYPPMHPNQQLCRLRFIKNPPEHYRKKREPIKYEMSDEQLSNLLKEGIELSKNRRSDIFNK